MVTALVSGIWRNRDIPIFLHFFLRSTEIKKREKRCITKAGRNVVLNNALDEFFINERRKEENKCIFNDALKTFYLRLYGVLNKVKNHYRERKSAAATT